jgi:hypothetical protein
MSGRFAYERGVLADRVLVGSMSLEELAAIPVVGTSDDSRHTVYDGHVVLFESKLGVLCDGSLTIEILGPYWDRVFRLELFGVQATQATDHQLLQGFDVKQIFLNPAEDGLTVFRMTQMFDEGEMSITFESATVSHFSLRNHLERPAGGAEPSAIN